MKKPDDILQEFKFILEESRVIIPGTQALLGFQFVSVFNQPFFQLLSVHAQQWHLFSTILTACSMILIMSPAAYHRAASHIITERLVWLSHAFLLFGMNILAGAICIDFFV